MRPKKHLWFGHKAVRKWEEVVKNGIEQASIT
jgi:hypothetical protein